MTEQERPILEEALRHYGFANQMDKTFEEMGELMTALSRFHLSDKYDSHLISPGDVITELADVSVMVDQLALHFGLSEFNAERGRKLQRLKQRMDEEKSQPGTNRQL